MDRAFILTLGLLLWASTGEAVQAIDGGGKGYQLRGDVDGNSSTYLDLTLHGVETKDASGTVPANVKFTCSPYPAGDRILVVTPCSGTTPTTVRITIDPHGAGISHPGVYHSGMVFSPSDAPGYSAIYFIDVTLTTTSPPVIGAVVSAASLQPTISPGEVISIFGYSLGAPLLAASPDNRGLYPTEFGMTMVTIGGVPAPVLFNNTSQINAVVPYSVAGQKTAPVVVWRFKGSVYEQYWLPFTVPVADTSPGIFTLTQNGSGQGAILNDGTTVTVNGPTNPAPKGSIVTLFGTGAGLWNPPIADGLVLTNVLQPPVVPQAAVSLSIGGQPAPILYAGAAPGMVSGVLQVNALVPNNIGSGAQPVVLSVGQNNNAQQSVTIAIQ